jgi:PhzF family phenazine biosynthesis protein
VGALTQEVGNAVFDLSVEREDGRIVIAMIQGPPNAGDEVAAERLAGPLGLDVMLLHHQPARVVSTGAAHLLVRARDRAAVDAARPNAPVLAEVLAEAGAQGAYLYANDPDQTAYARFFNPTVGLWEDSATGSAAGPLAWWLGDRDHSRLTVEQGRAMGRPSRLEVAVDDDVVTLRGSAVLSAEGRLYIPPSQEDSR